MHTNSLVSTNNKRERVLLILAALFVALIRIALTLARHLPWYSLWPLLVWGACALLLHIGLTWLLPLRDPIILPVVMLMAGWGIVLTARLAPAFSTRQPIWLVVAALASLAIARLSPGLRILRRYRYSWLIAGIILLAATLIFGVNPSGGANAPRLWLGFGFIYFQPSEILKLLMVIFMASYLADKRDILSVKPLRVWKITLPTPQYIAPLLLMWGFCMILLIWQRDLGTASLFFIIFLGMLYVATNQTGYLLVGLVLLMLSGLAGYFLFDVVRLRVDAWLNPWPEASGRAFQIVQSLLAIASGGLFGQGIGQGSPTYIPVVHSDFVLAAIAEEWGLMGAVGVIASLAILIFRGLRIAAKNVDQPFKSLLAAGISLSLGIQSLLIAGGVLKLIPLTGVTFPFISYGGSSLLSGFVMIGLLWRLSDPATNRRIDQPIFSEPSLEFTP
nr:FtsW/RodA/SpoVE family cell cycle protein [Anaerolineae bacterium]